MAMSEEPDSRRMCPAPLPLSRFLSLVLGSERAPGSGASLIASLQS
jgi:hypothetical protein